MTDDGREMWTERRARVFVKAFWMLDPDERVEILADHDLINPDYMPDRADELRNWYRTALNRAKKQGKLESVSDDVFSIIRERKRSRGMDPEDVGIMISNGEGDPDPTKV